MTSKTHSKGDTDDRRIISYEPSKENRDFIEKRKQKQGATYKFTIDKAVETLRKQEKAA